MNEKIVFDYFHGDEADNYAFYRVPKVLFTKAYFQDLSTDAKVLYGLMLDLISASRENRWIDENDNVYILFSIQTAMAYLGVCKNTAIKLYAELDSKTGIGLIDRIDRGQGRADKIYVRRIELPKDAKENERVKKIQDRRKGNESENEDSEGEKVVQKNDRSEKTTATESEKVVHNLNRSEKSTAMECDEVVQNLNRLNISTATESQKVVQKNDRCEITTTTESKNGPLEVQKMDPINTDFTNTESKRDIYSSSPSSCSEDGRTKRDVLIDILKNQIEYDYLIQESPYSTMKEIIESILNLIADTVLTAPVNGFEQINGRQYPHNQVAARYMKIDYETIKYVLDRFRENTSRIRYVTPYLRTALYNAKDEIELHVLNEVNCDFEEEKRNRAFAGG